MNRRNARFYCLKFSCFLFNIFKQYCLNFKQYLYPVKYFKKAMVQIKRHVTVIVLRALATCLGSERHVIISPILWLCGSGVVPQSSPGRNPTSTGLEQCAKCRNVGCTLLEGTRERSPRFLGTVDSDGKYPRGFLQPTCH